MGVDVAGMRMPRDDGFQRTFALAYLETLDSEEAALKAGVWRNARYYGNKLLKRPSVRRIIAEEQEARRIRLKIDPDFVLSALCRQLARLYAMQGQDIAELYTQDGKLKPIREWPAIFRRGLVAEIHTEETFEYSKDGVQAGESKTWDQSGQVTKIKRADALAIEKQITTTLAEIGRHVNVKAFPVPVSAGGDLHLHLHQEVTAKLQEALQREARLIEAKTDDLDNDR